MKWIGKNNTSDTSLADIISVSIRTDSGAGSRAEAASGDAEFSILGTSGVGVTNSGMTITATSVPGEINHNALLNYDAGRHFTQAGITTVGTIGTGVWQGTAIASAYLDSDTAHLSQSGQVFTGEVKFNEITRAIFDGDKTHIPGDGGVIHVDAHDVTDGNTSASGTAAEYDHVRIEPPRLMATNSSVTTTNASTLHIVGAPVASTNQTITNTYGLRVQGNIFLEGSGNRVGTIVSGAWQGTPIAHAYIGNDAIDGDNIADDSVNSEHYVDGSIDTAHIADDQITEDKLANTLLAEIDANSDKATNVTTNLTATTHASQITINSSDGTNVIVAEASGSIAGVMTVAHHDKLDGIETSATADQSKSDIDGLAITTVGTLDTGDATAIVSNASATVKGKVELATTAEADTGTDTVRAVTPAGLKSHVDTRYAYSYMTWSASAISSMDGSDPEWRFPNESKGVYEEDWTKDLNIKATSVGATTFAISRQSAVNALVIPHTGVCVGFHAHGRNNNSDATFKAGLFHLDGSTTGTTNNGGIDYGATGVSNECTLRWIATANEAEASGGADGTSGNSFKGPCKLVSNVTDTFAVTAGDALLPAIMGPDGSNEIFVTMTIILKIPLA